MSKKLFPVLFMFFINGTISGQTVLSGYIKDTVNQPLYGANIIVQALKGHKILSYAITNEKGYYKVLVKHHADSLVLSASYFGYQTQSRKIKNHSQHISFTMLPSAEQLKEVHIKATPVKIFGDTLNYAVRSLKTKEDRVLVDVIKKIPGIEISPNGKISYEGKPINKFYIENLDMLNGRYNMASNNIPVDQVASIQVYKNHQPIKLLDSLVFSDKAALNIRLKKNFSYALPYELASGYKAFLWKAKFIPMFFRKNSQMLDIIQTNNTGNRLKNTIADLSANQQTMVSYPQEFIRISNITPPPFDEDKWLDNTSHMAAFNYLIRLSKTATLKTNLFYVPEKEQAEAQTTETIFWNNQNLRLREFYQNEKINRLFDGNLVYEQNSRHVYLKNTSQLIYEKGWQRSLAEIENLHQSLETPQIHFKDDFTWLFPAGKQLLRLNGKISYRDNQNFYKITPGVFPQIFNNGQTYEQLNETVRQKNFNARLGSGLVKKIKHWTFQYYLTGIYRFQQLSSHITPTEYSLNLTDFHNKSDLKDWNIENLFNLIYMNGNWNFNLEIPLKYRYILITDRITSEKINIKGFYPDYDAYFGYRFNKINFGLKYTHKIIFDDLTHNYKHYILKSYNRLEKYDTPLNKNESNRYTILFKYKDILKGLYAGINFSISDNTSNILYHYQYEPDGSVEIKAMEKNNRNQNTQMILNIHKYFFKSKISTKIKSLYQWQEMPVFINNQLNNKTFKTWLLMSTVRIPVIKQLSVYFELERNAYLYDDKTPDLTKYKWSNEIFVYPAKEHSLHVAAIYYATPIDGHKDWFVNAGYEYKPTKRKWSIFARWNNITNIKTYTTYFNNAFSTYKSSYTLRPCSFLIGLKSAL